MRAPLKLLPLVLAGSLVLGACGGDDDASSAPSDTTVTTVADGSADSSTTTAATGKVSANEASRDEIAAALTAAGVANADRWAGEVVEYRPYTSASDEARLREELAKYNPDDATLEQILGALTIP